MNRGCYIAVNLSGIPYPVPAGYNGRRQPGCNPAFLKVTEDGQPPLLCKPGSLSLVRALAPHRLTMFPYFCPRYLSASVFLKSLRYAPSLLPSDDQRSRMAKM